MTAPLSDFLIVGETHRASALAEHLRAAGWTAETGAAESAASRRGTVLLCVAESFDALRAAAPWAVGVAHPRKWASLGTAPESGGAWEQFARTCMGVVVAGDAAARSARGAGVARVHLLAERDSAGGGGTAVIAEDSRHAARLAETIWSDVEDAREAARGRFQAELEAWPELARECAAQFHRPHALETPRFDRRHVREVVTRAREKHAGARIFYVTDTTIRLPDADVEMLASPTAAATVPGPKVFICAFASDEKLAHALGAVRAIPESVYLTPLVFWPTARYFHRNDAAWEVLRAEAALPPPKFALEDFENLIQALEATRHLEGDYVEVGVFQGRSAHCVLQYLRRVGLRRRSWLLDVYEGFTYAAAQRSSDAFWLNTHTETSEAGVREWMAEFPDAHVVKANIITDPLPVEVRRVVVANIDVDLYEAVVAAIQRLAPLIVPGGILILEDQGHTPPLAGAWLATHEFLNSPAAADFVPLHLTSGQLFLIRR